MLVASPLLRRIDKGWIWREEKEVTTVRKTSLESGDKERRKEKHSSAFPRYSMFQKEVQILILSRTQDICVRAVRAPCVTIECVAGVRT